MKKKGFTLVELLAVIAILAILVIIALPNVMKLFNDAKKNSFTNEVKEIYKAAQQEWMTDSMIATSELSYGRGSTASALAGCTDDALELSGRTQLQYGITITKSGVVKKYFATDGTYTFEYTQDSDEGLTIEQIGDTYSINNATGQNDALKCDSTNYVFD